MRDEHNLLCAARHEVARFGDDLRGRLAFLQSLERGNRAERAGRGTAIGNLDVRRRIFCIGVTSNRGDERTVVCAKLAETHAVLRLHAPPAQRFDEARELRPLRRADDAVNAMYVIQHLRAVTLRQTACGDEKLSGRFERGKLAQRVLRFLARDLQEAARIHDEHVSFRRIFRLLITILLHHRRHAFRVGDILGTT